MRVIPALMKTIRNIQREVGYGSNNQDVAAGICGERARVRVRDSIVADAACGSYKARCEVRVRAGAEKGGESMKDKAMKDLFARAEKAKALLEKSFFVSVERRYMEQMLEQRMGCSIEAWEPISVEEFLRRTEWANYFKMGTAMETLIQWTVSRGENALPQEGMRMTPWAEFRLRRKS